MFRIIANSLLLGFILNILLGIFRSALDINIESKFLGNSIVALIFFISFYICIKHRNNKEQIFINNFCHNKQSDHNEKNNIPFDLLNFQSPSKKNNIKIELEPKNIIGKDEDGFFTLWKGCPMTIYCRIEGESKGKEHTFYRWAISPKGYEKLFCRDQDGLEYLLDVWDIDTKITYKSQRYDLLDDLMQKIIGVSKFDRIDEMRTDYLNHLNELKEQRKAQFALKELYSFSPIFIRFSIFGDYFDTTKPANNMKFAMNCSGLCGYRVDGEEEMITELFGTNADTGEKVYIRLNAIRTMITFEDGRKYRKEAFIELAKTFK